MPLSFWSSIYIPNAFLLASMWSDMRAAAFFGLGSTQNLAWTSPSTSSVNVLITLGLPPM